MSVSDLLSVLSAAMMPQKAFFVAALFGIEVLLLYRVRRRDLFVLRLVTGTILFFCFCLIVPPLPQSMPVMLITYPIFLVSSLILWRVFDAPLISVCFLCEDAFLVQTIGESLYKMIIALTGSPYNAYPLLHIAIIAAVAMTAFYLLILCFDQAHLAVSGGKARLLQSILIGILIILIGSLLNQGQLEYDPLCRIVLIVVASMALSLQTFNLKAEQSEIENQVVQQLLEAEKAQYEWTVKSMEDVKRDIHDLKYYVCLLQNKSASDETVQKLSQGVERYDAVANTGNVVLDTVITEKFLYCRKNKIILSCMADGSAVGFIDRADLYVLLENAFDNAIEAVMKCSSEMRYIVFRLFCQQQLLSIHIENGCVDSPVFHDELPQTTKEDKSKHGYGVKSIRALAQLYHGHACFRCTDNVFALTVILPIPLEQGDVSSRIEQRQ